MASQSAVSTRIQLPESLRAAGFAMAEKPKHKRVILNVQAQEGCGKTRFALTAPGPIGYISMEYGLEGVIEPFLEQGKTIYPAFFKTDKLVAELSEKMTHEEWSEELRKVETAMVAAVTSDHLRTVVVDTGTEHWELVRLGEFGKVAQVMPEQYGPANRRMRLLIEIAYQRPNLNLVILSKMGKRYVKAKGAKRGDWDGTYEHKGWSDLPYVVQDNIELYKEENMETERMDFCCRFLKIRQDEGQGAMDLVLRNGDIDFPTVAQLIHPSSTARDWEDVG